jgi:antitoxin (DNA-binding transcriptional repressor) of toxin-antitoxin stability system
MSASNVAIGVTAFKAKCLALIDDVAQGKTERVVLLKHNKPVAEIVAVAQDAQTLWGSMSGCLRVAEGVALTESTGEDWEAER